MRPAERSAVIAFETAAAEYLAARVAALHAIPGNPYGAALKQVGPLLGVLVEAAPTPMLNRICGDAAAAPDAFTELLDWFHDHRCAPSIPWVAPRRQPKPAETVGNHTLKRLNGWTHAVLGARIDALPLPAPSVEPEALTPATIGAFAQIHANAFRTPPANREANKASFAGLLATDRAEAFLARVDGEPVAGAVVFYAANDVAYLATAATTSGARGKGCHGALIVHRIAAARERGCRFVAATATPNSQSRHNLERLGLTVSHTRTLYTTG